MSRGYHRSHVSLILSAGVTEVLARELPAHCASRVILARDG